MNEPTADEQAYFRQIEDTFIELRGAPFLLSSADWRLTQTWYQAGIPLALVCEALREVFARRAERGGGGKVQGLRYCAAAVDSAWQERRELGGAAMEGDAYAMDVEGRLSRLAASLPAGLPNREPWAARIRAAGAAPREVEEELARLDGELVGECLSRLTEQDRQDLERSLGEALREIEGRLAAEGLAADRARLLRERVRDRVGLPLLSLFSPAATD